MDGKHTYYSGYSLGNGCDAGPPGIVPMVIGLGVAMVEEEGTRYSLSTFAVSKPKGCWASQVSQREASVILSLPKAMRLSDHSFAAACPRALTLFCSSWRSLSWGR